MFDYEINNETLAIIPLGEERTKIVECRRNFIVDKNSMEIISNSCEYFGSSYEGRLIGTKNLIGAKYKAPIIIEETSEIIFFPTSSPRIVNCAWISLNNLKNYKRHEDSTIIMFNNGNLLNLDISYAVVDNQVLRATRLSSILRLRKNKN